MGIVFLLSLFLSLSVALDAEERVINGQAADVTFPVINWQVALEISVGTSKSLCGGSIVADRYVVTAAHCLKRLVNGGNGDRDTFQNPENMRVKPGRDRGNDNAADRFVQRYWVEPSYSSGTGQSRRIDVGIMEMTQPFDFSLPVSNPKHAGIISMCSGNLCFPENAPIFVSGYGQRVSGESGSTPEDLFYADLFAVDQTACENKFAQNFGCQNCLPTADICASSNPANANPNKDSCFGDSGGPLVINLGSEAAPNFQLVGVVSSGTVPAGQTPACGKQGEFGLYVSIMNPTVRAFLDNAMNGNLDNNTAIDNDCVAANTCSSFTPEDPGGFWIFPGFDWQWYYILAICLGGILLIVLLILCCKCCCGGR